MVIVGVYIIVFLVYFKCPRYLKLVILGINLFLPDLLPVADEAIMIIGIFATRSKQVKQGMDMLKARKEAKRDKDSNIENALE